MLQKVLLAEEHDEDAPLSEDVDEFFPKDTEESSRSFVVNKIQAPSSQFHLPFCELPHTCKRSDLKGCDAFVLDGVLTEQECSELIMQTGQVKQGDGAWSFWDDSRVPRVHFRNADTIEVTHNDLADMIWSRVAEHVNPSIVITEDDDRFEDDILGAWYPYGINPNMLFARYLNGGHFSPHTDGTTTIDFNRRTFYTVIIFLNSSPWGGETRIYQNAQMQKELVDDGKGRLTGDPMLILDAVKPEPGRAIVFYHRLMHEGVPAAEKHIIRTDILYHRSPEICIAPEDVEAFKMYMEYVVKAESGECDAAIELLRKAMKLSPALRNVYKM